MSRWPELGVDSITFKEMLPIVWALAVYWKDSVYCDNTGAVNSGYSKIPRIMPMFIFYPGSVQGGLNRDACTRGP